MTDHNFAIFFQHLTSFEDWEMLALHENEANIWYSQKMENVLYDFAH